MYPMRLVSKLSLDTPLRAKTQFQHKNPRQAGYTQEEAVVVPLEGKITVLSSRGGV